VKGEKQFARECDRGRTIPKIFGSYFRKPSFSMMLL
jgi:hypothetical protein